MEIWGSARSLPGRSAPIARRAESEGWTGLAYTDSQNLSGDPYVALASAAAATSTLRFSTGVTNPWTRHPAVTASAIACVDIESDGRAELGIGRGDSALAYVGLAPAPLPRMQRYLEVVKTYLAGGSVPMERAMDSGTHPIDASLPLGEAPAHSRIEWLATRHPGRRPVPLFVVASGPKMIELAARLGDRVTLAVGAEPARVRWAVDIAKAARPDVAIGAYVNVLVDDDRERALAMAAGSIASIARFSAMHGRVHGPVSQASQGVLEGVPQSYRLTHHFENAVQSELITPEFARDYAVLGSPSYCIERLEELAELGIDRFHVVGASRDVATEDAVASRKRFVAGVLSKLAPSATS